MRELDTSLLRSKVRGFRIGVKLRKPFAVLMFLIITSVIFLYTEYFTALSINEIWTFGFSKNIWDGLIPYKDFDIATSPLPAYIFAPASISIHLFRLLSGIIHAAILYISFNLINGYSRKFIFKAALTLMMAVKLMVYSYLSYNDVMILFLLLSFLSLSKYMDTEKGKYIFITGMLLSISALFQQTCAGVIVLITIPVFVYMVKNETKRHFPLYMLGGLIPVGIIISVSFLFGYTKEMVSSMLFSLLELPEYSGFTLELLFPAISVILAFILTLSNRNFNCTFAFLYILGMAGYLYPLFDTVHIYGFMLMVLPLLCVYKWPFSIEKVILFMVPVFMTGVLFMYHPVVQYYRSPASVIGEGEFEYVRIFDEARDKHSEVIGYMKEHEDGLNLSSEAEFDYLSLGTHQVYKGLESLGEYKYVVTDRDQEELIGYLEGNGYDSSELGEYLIWTNTVIN